MENHNTNEGFLPARVLIAGKPVAYHRSMERAPRGIPPESEPHPVPKIYDATYAYRGTYTEGSVCHLRIFHEQGCTPVIVATELPENKNTPITNMAEILAAEVMRKHFPGRFGADEPASWIEHYPRPKTRWMQRIMWQKEFDRVPFASWRPRVTWYGGKQRLTLGEPEWKHLLREELAKLIGQVEVDRDVSRRSGTNPPTTFSLYAALARSQGLRKRHDQWRPSASVSRVPPLSSYLRSAGS